MTHTETLLTELRHLLLSQKKHDALEIFLSPPQASTYPYLILQISKQKSKGPHSVFQLEVRVFCHNDQGFLFESLTEWLYSCLEPRQGLALSSHALSLKKIQEKRAFSAPKTHSLALTYQGFVTALQAA